MPIITAENLLKSDLATKEIVRPILIAKDGRIYLAITSKEGNYPKTLKILQETILDPNVYKIAGLDTPFLFRNLQQINDANRFNKKPVLLSTSIFTICSENTYRFFLDHNIDDRVMRTVSIKHKKFDACVWNHHKVNLIKILGDHFFPRIANGHSTEDIVKLAFKKLWHAVRQANKGKLPPNPNNHPPLSRARIHELSIFIQERNTAILLRGFNPVLASRATCLPLMNRNLTKIPAEVQRFPKIKKILARGNHIISISPEIGFLRELTILDLSENNLTDVPRGIKYAIFLRVLYLDHNSIKTLSTELTELAFLEELHVAFNQLSYVPPAFKSLRLLSTVGNPLLPDIDFSVTTKRKFTPYEEECLSRPDQRPCDSRTNGFTCGDDHPRSYRRITDSKD